VDFGRPDLGPYPFAALPRDYRRAVARFGAETLKQIGMLPWREAEEFDNLRKAFTRFARNDAYAAGDAVLFAAVASHYIQDAYMPLHASNNHDGQLTGQTGVHARFETALFERYQARLKVAPAPSPPVTNARDTAFDVLLASHQLVPALLDADKRAAAGRQSYDDQYFAKFFEAAGPMLEQQLARSISATVAIIAGAWQQAGSPTLATKGPPPVQRVR
jgi:hypothetical protein